jgi:hypothetical protein
VACDLKNDGEDEEGRRCMFYDVTGQVIMTINVHEKMIADEIWRVKALAGDQGGGCVQDMQMDGELYDGDKLKAAKNIGVGDGVR